MTCTSLILKHRYPYLSAEVCVVWELELKEHHTMHAGYGGREGVRERWNSWACTPDISGSFVPLPRSQ